MAIIKAKAYAMPWSDGDGPQSCPLKSERTSRSSSLMMEEKHEADHADLSLSHLKGTAP